MGYGGMFWRARRRKSTPRGGPDRSRAEDGERPDQRCGSLCEPEATGSRVWAGAAAGDFSVLPPLSRLSTLVTYFGSIRLEPLNFASSKHSFFLINYHAYTDFLMFLLTEPMIMPFLINPLSSELFLSKLPGFTRSRRGIPPADRSCPCHARSPALLVQHELHALTGKRTSRSGHFFYFVPFFNQCFRNESDHFLKSGTFEFCHPVRHDFM
jgi:hypothetical protein